MENMTIDLFSAPKNFPVTAACDDLVGNSLIASLQKIIPALQKLEITGYSNKYKAVFFVFESFANTKEGAKRMQARTRMRNKTQVLEIYVPVNYIDLVNSDIDFTDFLLAEAYLDGIEKFLIPRKDFDGKRFYKDVKQLFEPFLQTQTMDL